MHQAKDDLLHRTIEIWQRRSARELSLEDARQMVENAVGFFRILVEWEKAARRADRGVGSSDGDRTDG